MFSKKSGFSLPFHEKIIKIEHNIKSWVELKVTTLLFNFTILKHFLKVKKGFTADQK